VSNYSTGSLSESQDSSTESGSESESESDREFDDGLAQKSRKIVNPQQSEKGESLPIGIMNKLT
jgi:hypothetical protein